MNHWNVLNKVCRHSAALFTELWERLCPHTKTQRGQTVLWQQLHQIAKSLSQLYLSTSGIEGQNLNIVNAILPKHVFSLAIWCSAQRRATPGLLLRGTRLRGLMFGWGQHAHCQTTLVVRSVITVRGCLILALCKVISRHATTLSFALLLNLRSQYPKANLKQLSLSLWESGTMSKSHHLTE